MLRRRVVIRGAQLAAATVITVPAVAQARPKFYDNNVNTGTERVPVIFYDLQGRITQKNKMLGKIACNTATQGWVWNETTEGTEKGLAKLTGFSAGECNRKSRAR
jgi:hypothetical protein